MSNEQSTINNELIANQSQQFAMGLVVVDDDALHLSGEVSFLLPAVEHLLGAAVAEAIVYFQQLSPSH